MGFMDFLTTRWEQAKVSGNEGFSRATAQIINRNITVRESARNADRVKQTAEKVQKSEPKQIPKNETKQVPQSTTKSAAKSKNTSGSSTKNSKKNK